MMKRYDFLVGICLAGATFIAGCAASPEEEDGELGTARSTAITTNALTTNALAPTMLSNAALATGALGTSALSAIQDPGADGDLSRELLQYTVSCALDATQSVSFTWVDASGVSHDETYVGALGLATSWASGALSEVGQRWVSACLISRVNHFGVSVSISSRGGHTALASSASELAAYTEEEGAFWGNLFGSTPTAYACEHTPNVAHSRSRQRVCAAGWVDGSGTVQSCEVIERLGSCADACGALAAGQYYGSCSNASGQSSSQVVTVFLK